MPLPNHDRKPRVLVVDDDPLQVELLTRLLSGQEMEVWAAHSGKECLRLVCRRSPDVIVLNVTMPEMSGLEVCRALKKIPAARLVPVILLTARDDLETRTEAMKLGVSEFVAKPARSRNLLARIRTQIEAGQKLREMERAVKHGRRRGAKNK